MIYWLLNIIFLMAVALVALATILAGRSPRWRTVGAALLAVMILTAVFDNVLVGAGIVAYDRSRISGAFVGFAPVEDFSYAVAAVVLLPCLWMLSESRPPAERSRADRPRRAR